MQWIAIVIHSILACIGYRIIHDQITARICVEYFTIGHPPIISTDDPTVLGIVWGFVATWWVREVRGVPLANCARIGTRPKMTARSLLGPTPFLFASSAVFAVTAGLVGYLATSMGWVWLVGPFAEDIPPEKHTAFLVDLWAHCASYIGGFVGSIILMAWVWRSRRLAATQIETEQSVQREQANTPELKA